MNGADLIIREKFMIFLLILKRKEKKYAKSKTRTQ